jgi:hypothetical protein
VAATFFCSTGGAVEGAKYRQVYSCEGTPPAIAVSVLGRLPKEQKVTLITRDQKAAATVREILPNQVFSVGFLIGTRLDAPTLTRCDGMIASLTSAEQVELVQLVETMSDITRSKLLSFVEKLSNQDMRTKDFGNLGDPKPYDLRWPNHQVTELRQFLLAPNLTVATAVVKYDEYSGDNRPRKDCDRCYEQDALLVMNNNEMIYLSEDLCDYLVSAFKISGRIHIHRSSHGCGNGIRGESVLDLSDPVPVSIFSDFDLSD